MSGNLNGQSTSATSVTVIPEDSIRFTKLHLSDRAQAIVAARKAGLGRGAGIGGRGQRAQRSLFDAIDILADKGAEATILGCVEPSLIIDEDDGVIPGFDTTRIHAIAAVDASQD